MLSPAPVTFKANTVPTPLHALSGMSVLAIQGRDAAAFLQAQLMNDVAALAQGHWHWSGWLNAKGRVIALFALARTGEDEFLLVLPDFPASELAARLQRYVFRSKLSLLVREDLQCAAEFPDPAASPQTARDLVSTEADGALSLDMSGHALPRKLWLLPAGSPRLLPPDTATDQDWYRHDLAHGLPRLADGQSEAWTPQMLSLERLRAFSLKKGCYPGQEIVARTHYLGKAKRGLARLRGRNPVAGARVHDDAGQELGSIVCSKDGEALAVLTLEHAGAGLHADGQMLDSLPLEDGLQRPV